MALPSTLRLILKHPLNRRRPLPALARYALWQIKMRLASGRVRADWIEGTALKMGPKDSAVAGNIYCGLLEFEDMGFALHLLRPGDRFVDVGANAGTYTVLACGVVGAEGVAFEPAPQTFERLRDNVRLNGLEQRVACRPMAVGDAAGVLRFTTNEDVTNHVVTGTDDDASFIEVPAGRLDDLLGDTMPTLIKIDVEGYEAQVLRGAKQVLRCPTLLAVILELNRSGVRRYDCDETEAHTSLVENGFEPYRYDPRARTVSPTGGVINRNGKNTLYLRSSSLQEIVRRLESAPSRLILGTLL